MDFSQWFPASSGPCTPVPHRLLLSARSGSAPGVACCELLLQGRVAGVGGVSVLLVQLHPGLGARSSAHLWRPHSGSCLQQSLSGRACYPLPRSRRRLRPAGAFAAPRQWLGAFAPRG